MNRFLANNLTWEDAWVEEVTKQKCEGQEEGMHFCQRHGLVVSMSMNGVACHGMGGAFKNLDKIRNKQATSASTA